VGDRGLPCRSRAGSSRRCWPPASGSCAWPRSGWAPRRGERTPGKSDQIDSLAIARAVVKDGADSFPVAYLDEQAMEIRLLCDHRTDLVVERTRVTNRLRWHLLELCPELERSLKRGSLNQPRVLDRVARRLRQLGTVARVRVARDQVAVIRSLNGQIDALKRELRVLVEAHRPELLAEVGCGELTAALLIGRTAGAERFKSDASFAMQSGSAPIPCSSGQRTQYRLNRGGDRQLNHALHIIAVTRANHDPATKEYLARKQRDGKTKKGALRCLKRYLARRFHRILSLPSVSSSPSDRSELGQIAPGRRRAGHTDVEPLTAAPCPMPCLA